jgi:hypothetical protein
MMSRPLDEFHAHEVLHVASLIADLFDREVVEHPWTKIHVQKEAEAVMTALGRFYQQVGKISHEIQQT